MSNSHVLIIKAAVHVVLDDAFTLIRLSDSTRYWFFQQVKQLLLLTGHKSECDTDQTEVFLADRAFIVEVS